MSVPPDNFDDGEPPDFDEEFVAYRAEGDVPQWFVDHSELFWQIDHLDSVYMQVNTEAYAGWHQLNDDGVTYTVPILAIDNDTGDTIYEGYLDHFTYEELQDFYYYTENYYDDVVFWPEGGSGDLGAF
jgi:hypothetical protein